MPIIQIGLVSRAYQYIEPGDDTSSISVGDLDGLLHGIANGLYAINYLENGQD